MRSLVFLALASLACRSDGQDLFGFNPLKGLQNAIKNPAGALKNASENFNRVISNPVESFRDIVNKTSTVARNFTTELSQKVRDGLTDPAGAVTNATRDLGQALGGSATNEATIDAPGSATVGGLGGVAESPANDDGTSGTRSNAGNDIRKTFESALGNPFGALQNLTSNLDQGLRNSVDGTLSSLNDVSKTIGKGLTDVVNDPLGALTNLTETANKSIGNVVNRTIGSLRNSTKSAGKDLRNLIGNPLGGLQNLTKGLTDAIGASAAKSKSTPFDWAFALLDDAVQSDSVLGVLWTAGPAIFQAIRPVLSGGSAKQALERINKIEERASEVSPYFVSFLLMGPLNSIKMPLNGISIFQSLFGLA